MIKSYCKINLFLKVLNKLGNGLHNIQAINVLLKLHDDISIKPIFTKEDKIIFKGKFTKYINKNKNSITETMLLLRKHQHIKSEQKYKVVVNKKIPVFAGLGGGTSNAACVMRYFLKNKINNRILSIFEKKIGSDLRLFFFENSFQKSLFNFKEFKKKQNFYFILIYPNTKCSTKTIYSKVEVYETPLKLDPTMIKSKEKYIRFIKNEGNSLQKIVEKKHKKINFVLRLIESQKNCVFSRMSGSGSACYGLFKDKKKATDALKIIKKKLPNFWCVITKTI